MWLTDESGAPLVTETGANILVRQSLREASFEAMAARLRTALPGVPVERNRRAEPDLDKETLPRLVVHDGDQQARGSDAWGTTLHRVQALIEGFVTSPEDADLGMLANDLHARVVAALCGQEIPIQSDQTIWVEEEQLGMMRWRAGESARPMLGFTLQVGFDLRAPDQGGPFATTT